MMPISLLDECLVAALNLAWLLLSIACRRAFYYAKPQLCVIMPFHINIPESENQIIVNVKAWSRIIQIRWPRQ